MAKALLFIPDITGFTHFVTNNDQNHHSHIITELLELLIDTNELGMELMEIEGDALLFYTPQMPTSEMLFHQIQKMYIRFHQHLNLYDTHRVCQCGACTMATGLGLKFFIHIGDVQTVKIKKAKKLHGQEVIKIHRLMKNSVPLREYTLLTKEALDFLNKSTDLAPITENSNWKEGAEHFGSNDIGTAHYQYQGLSSLKSKVAIAEIIYDDKVKNPLRLSTQIEASTRFSIELLADLRYRMQWNRFIKKLEYNRLYSQKLICKKIL